MPEPPGLTVVISEVAHTAGVPVNLDCPHTPHVPPYNAEACRWLSVEQVRAQYPRFDALCTLCHQACRIYASLAHMQAGGWT